MWPSLLSALQAKGSNIEIVYHWTREENINTIVENNLRVAGDVNTDGSRIATAHGSVYGRGIYAATNISFGKNFGKGARCALLCLAIPGRSTPAGRSGLAEDSDSFRQGALRVYRTSDQLLPLFTTSEAYAPQAEEAAEQVARLLQPHVVSRSQFVHHSSPFGRAAQGRDGVPAARHVARTLVRQPNVTRCSALGALLMRMCS